VTALEVLHLDNHLLAVAKPAGVPVVPDASGDASLLDVAKAWLKSELDKPGAVFLGVVHRLDRPVSGVVLFARTSKSAARLAEQFRSRSVRKAYLAVLEGDLAADAGELEQWLLKDERANRVRAVAARSEGAMRAATSWKVAARKQGRTLLLLEPQTGRPHQLRVAAAEGLGAPILGDLKYGASRALADASIALHAWRLSIEHPTRREPVQLGCPVPEVGWWSEWRTELGCLPPH
jgi:23S rRNA pseudouridine1911/1915/1917 synthase